MKTLCLLLFCGTAHAQFYDLKYVGALMTGTSDIHQPLQAATGSWNGDLILSGPLAANLNNAAVTPLSLVFVGPNALVTNDNPSPMTFSTDAQGNITAWSMMLHEGTGGQHRFSADFTSGPIDSYDIVGDCIGNYTTNCEMTMQSTQAGTWFSDISGKLTQISVSAPEIDPKGAGAEFLILAFGLAVLRGRRI